MELIDTSWIKPFEKGNYAKEEIKEIYLSSVNRNGDIISKDDSIERVTKSLTQVRKNNTPFNEGGIVYEQKNVT